MCRGYYVDTCENANKIQEYIKNQLMEDQAHDQRPRLRGEPSNERQIKSPCKD